MQSIGVSTVCLLLVISSAIGQPLEPLQADLQQKFVLAAIKGAAGAVGSGVASGAGYTMGGVKNVANVIGHGANYTVGGAKNVANVVGHGANYAVGGAKNVGGAVVTGAGYVASGAKKAAGTIYGGARSIAGVLKNVAGSIAKLAGPELKAYAKNLMIGVEKLAKDPKMRNSIIRSFALMQGMKFGLNTGAGIVSNMANDMMGGLINQGLNQATSMIAPQGIAGFDKITDLFANGTAFLDALTKPPKNVGPAEPEEDDGIPDYASAMSNAFGDALKNGMDFFGQMSDAASKASADGGGNNPFAGFQAGFESLTKGIQNPFAPPSNK